MKTKTTPARVARWPMIGGGTAYSVLFRCADKPSRPLHNGHIYATQIGEGGRHYYRPEDAIMPRAVWSMEPGLEKLHAMRRNEARAQRLAIRIARRAFPELRGLKKLPSLWAPWTLPAKVHAVQVRLELPE